MDLFLSSLFFTVLLAAIGLVVYLVPKVVIAATESESEPNLYSVFWDESGYHGVRITSGIGVFLPISYFMNVSLTPEGIVFMLIFAGYLGFHHFQTYSGYNLLNKRYFIVLGIVVAFFITSETLLVLGYWTNAMAMTSFIFCGLFWGAFVVLLRAEKVLHNKKL